MGETRRLKKKRIFFICTLFSQDILDIAINIRDRLRIIEILHYLGRINTFLTSIVCHKNFFD